MNSLYLEMDSHSFSFNHDKLNERLILRCAPVSSSVVTVGYILFVLY